MDGTTNSSSTQSSIQGDGIAKVDFAQSLSTSDEKEITGGGASEGLFFISQGMSSVSSTTQSSSTEQSSQQIQSGNTTFTLPDFSKDNGVEALGGQGDVLSPTQTRDEDAKN